MRRGVKRCTVADTSQARLSYGDRIGVSGQQLEALPIHGGSISEDVLRASISMSSTYLLENKRDAMQARVHGSLAAGSDCKPAWLVLPNSPSTQARNEGMASIASRSMDSNSTEFVSSCALIDSSGSILWLVHVLVSAVEAERVVRLRFSASDGFQVRLRGEPEALFANTVLRLVTKLNCSALLTADCARPVPTPTHSDQLVSNLPTALIQHSPASTASELIIFCSNVGPFASANDDSLKLATIACASLLALLNPLVSSACAGVAVAPASTPWIQDIGHEWRGSGSSGHDSDQVLFVTRPVPIATLRLLSSTVSAFSDSRHYSEIRSTTCCGIALHSSAMLRGKLVTDLLLPPSATGMCAQCATGRPAAVDRKLDFDRSKHATVTVTSSIVGNLTFPFKITQKSINARHLTKVITFYSNFESDNPSSCKNVYDFQLHSL